MSFARQSAAKTAVCVCACRYLCRWSWNSRPELDPLPLRGGIIVEFDGFFFALFAFCYCNAMYISCSNVLRRLSCTTFGNRSYYNWVPRWVTVLVRGSACDEFSLDCFLFFSLANLKKWSFIISNWSYFRISPWWVMLHHHAVCRIMHDAGGIRWLLYNDYEPLVRAQ